MNLIISLLYAPIVLLLFKNFEIKSVAIFVFILSFIWFLINLKKGFKEYMFSILYMIFSTIAYFISNGLFLKIVPSFLAFMVSMFVLYSYFTKSSFVIYYIEKFKKNLSNEEKIYLQNSTLFWFFVSFINFIIHIFVLYYGDITIWAIYSSFAWYLVFIFGLIIQIIHKKLFFKKENYA
ncbi:hypothetical protein CRU87_06950 [Aliarcobacter trophiarum LMG 25534]|uniref:Membrane protein n=1 Tax=Aliarcobacter trophiarum LMG 25534 TaxID=1032241 RepID=A0AAD0QLW0_9BACT|nr:hypothetical protein [Aliarcobacter trophiarum]AXK49070.1 putative membrane protein [Aliarcobacter trophiarum LMG 25534]RXI28236.1 hypothetical protein CRU89_02155 [Aliarcobacter trophiarum]RXJ90959.1 hypothetical protein CRU87_06950 [Aliarcobacter trophiarum LMG 25534]